MTTAPERLMPFLQYTRQGPPRRRASSVKAERVYVCDTTRRPQQSSVCACENCLHSNHACHQRTDAGEGAVQIR